MKWTPDDITRYSRHLSLEEVGIEGQEKFRTSSVLIVGAGGLGGPAMQYLTAAGVGRIGIVDGDSVALSNLQRQVIFNEVDVGKNKAEVASVTLGQLNAGVELIAYPYFISSKNAITLINDYDIVVDGTDNLPAKYLLNDACVLAGKPLVYGSIYKFEGQVSVFNHRMKDGKRGPNYRDLYPVPPPPRLVPSCAEGGVLGVLPGFIGTLQASECLKIILGSREILSGKLFLADLNNLDFRTINFAGKEGNNVEKLIDYNYFCNSNSDQPMKSVTVHDLKKMMDSEDDFQLVDVREAWEHEFTDIGGELIPQSSILEKFGELARDKKVIVYCRSGKRSANVISMLEKTHDLQNLYNLDGGILAWSAEIDPSITPY